MPIHDYKCNNCDFSDEFIVGSSIKDSIPNVCPKCKKGTLEKQTSFGKLGIDVVGGYDYVYGKKNWKKNLSKKKQIEVAEGKRDPY